MQQNNNVKDHAIYLRLLDLAREVLPSEEAEVELTEDDIVDEFDIENSPTRPSVQDYADLIE